MPRQLVLASRLLSALAASVSFSFVVPVARCEQLRRLHRRNVPSTEAERPSSSSTTARWLTPASEAEDEWVSEDGTGFSVRPPVAGVVASLSEKGYQEVTKTESSFEMEKFARRLVEAMGIKVSDEVLFRRMIPEYSGQRGQQSLFALKRDILKALRPGGWATEDTSVGVDVLGTPSGASAPLNESGYDLVFRLHNSSEMEAYARRAVDSLNLLIVNAAPLRRLATAFSTGGAEENRSLAELRLEILKTVRSSEPWAVSGEDALLTEGGYRAVSATKSDEELAAFVRRVIWHEGCRVTNQDGLSNLVRRFADGSGPQSFDALEKEVFEACGLTDKGTWFGSFHDVVGKSGVLQIQPRGANAEHHRQRAMNVAGIVTTPFSATDAGTAGAQELKDACPLSSNASVATVCSRRGGDVGHRGCRSPDEQAIVASHRRALMAASQRFEEWTAIIEDDVVPLHPGLWDDAFRRAWREVPVESKLVRLNWCTSDQQSGAIRRKTFKDVGYFRLVKYMSRTDDQGIPQYYADGCTSGYVVHKDLLPELLQMFPCCCNMECCLERQLYYAPTKPVEIDGMYRGEQIMISMDSWDSREAALNYTSFSQGGVMVRDGQPPSWRGAP